MSLDLTRVRAFESELDAALAARPLFSCDANASLHMACNLCEMVYDRPEDRGVVGMFDRGTNIVARFLVSGASGPPPAIETGVHDLVFASHYYLIRDYLYFSYNAPNAIDWQWREGRVEIRFADATIPRQYYTEFNNHLIDSRDVFGGFDPTPIEGLLQGVPEFVMSENIAKAADLIDEEVDIKVRAYFSLIELDSQTDLGGYSYQQFLTIYRALLAKALYHRHFVRANDGRGGAVFLSVDELLDEAAKEMPRQSAALVLRDLVFDADSARERTDPSYFSLLREGAAPRRIWMRPHQFSLSDGLVDLFRIVAHRRPGLFLSNVSHAMGRHFARRVREAFEAQGLVCHSDISLRKFGTHLPDIDLIAITEEPTLGFVMFVCELKGVIPAGWAKDRLRALNTGGMAKAFGQIEAVQAFLNTDEGLQLVRKLLPPDGLPGVDGFVLVFRYLIITSDNAGMFFGGRSTKVINFRMLARLLKRSDGDTALILNVLSTYDEHADAAIQRKMIEFQMGERTVAYEAVIQSPLLDFPARKWRNSQERQQMIDEFRASGAHPFDTFASEGPHTETTNEPESP